jgi:hypothetical protein
MRRAPAPVEQIAPDGESSAIHAKRDRRNMEMGANVTRIFLHMRDGACGHRPSYPIVGGGPNCPLPAPSPNANIGGAHASPLGRNRHPP